MPPFLRGRLSLERESGLVFRFVLVQLRMAWMKLEIQMKWQAKMERIVR